MRWNLVTLALANAISASSVMSNVLPNESLRTQAEVAMQEARKLAPDLTLELLRIHRYPGGGGGAICGGADGAGAVLTIPLSNPLTSPTGLGRGGPAMPPGRGAICGITDGCSATLTAPLSNPAMPGRCSLDIIPGTSIMLPSCSSSAPRSS